MCIMAPVEIKKDIYAVMTKSRELTNYCQESVKSSQSRKISDALDNFHLKTSIDFLTKSLADEDRLFFELNVIDSNDQVESEIKETYNKVIDYIETNLIGSDL